MDNLHHKFYAPTTHCVVPDDASQARDTWIRTVVQYLRVRSAPVARTAQFTAEDIAIEMKVLKFNGPSDSRHWGLAMQRAKREGLIVETGETRATKAGHRTPVWQYA